MHKTRVFRGLWAFSPMAIFARKYFLQYLLISWFRLFSSNSFSILRLFTKCQLLKFTFKDFTDLSLLQISVQIRNSMQIFWGSNCTFWTHQVRSIYCSLSIGYLFHICQIWGSDRPLWLTCSVVFMKSMVTSATTTNRFWCFHCCR